MSLLSLQSRRNKLQYNNEEYEEQKQQQQQRQQQAVKETSWMEQFEQVSDKINVKNPIQLINNNKIERVINKPILSQTYDSFLATGRECLTPFHKEDAWKPHEFSNYARCFPLNANDPTNESFLLGESDLHTYHYYEQDLDAPFNGWSKSKHNHTQLHRNISDNPNEPKWKPYNDTTDWYAILTDEKSPRPFILQFPVEPHKGVKKIQIELPFKLTFSERPTLKDFINQLELEKGKINLHIPKYAFRQFLGEEDKKKWFLVRTIRISEQVSQGIPFDLNIQFISSYKDKKIQWISPRGPSFSYKNNDSGGLVNNPRTFTLHQNVNVVWPARDRVVFQIDKEIIEHPEFCRSEKQITQ